MEVLDRWIVDMDALLIAVGRLHTLEDAVAVYNPAPMLARGRHRAKLEQARRYPIEHRRALLAEVWPA